MLSKTDPNGDFMITKVKKVVNENYNIYNQSLMDYHGLKKSMMIHERLIREKHVKFAVTQPLY